MDEVFLYLPLKTLEKDVTLSNGIIFPKITLGVCQLKTFQDIYHSVDAALEVGYRSFDCSPRLNSEINLGMVLEELLPEHKLQREDILITSRILPRDYGTDTTSEAIMRSCESLQTDYIDLVLMDWPGGHNLDPDDEESHYLRNDTWKEMLEMETKGVIKGCGVSNFTSAHLEEIRMRSGSVPLLLQTEFHPKCPQVELLGYCEENNIVVQACSFKDTIHPLIQSDDTIKMVAKKVKKTPTQVVLN